jgi:exportin-2 (importin alpha re-exporter)
MSLNEQTLSELTACLEKTLSPQPEIRRPAEKLLEQMESHSNYGSILLVLCNKQDLAIHLRITASITFKNYIKKNWKCSEENDFADKIQQQDRDAIKFSITDLMLTSPEQIQRQLSDAISIISREDFPDKWPNLLPTMVEKLKAGDFHIINGILRTAHSIFKRYRHEFKSNELWKEIKYVLGLFAVPVTELFQTLISMIEKHANDLNSIKLIFSSLILISKIFRSLIAQDFPEEFENNMEIWMTHFLSLLGYENPLLQSSNDEAGLLEQVKSQICDNISLFAQNYGEDFADYLPKFVTAVWNLLVTTSLQSKYDLLVSNAIQFITAVVYRPQYKSLFENEESLKSICEKIVLPNLFLRDIDIEIFEDNPEEYIRKDIERSDTDTRRRAASDLVQALCAQFEKQVVAIFSSYVQALLAEYSLNPAKNWRQKDVVLFLVTTLASRGQTKKHGTTKASELIDVIQFFESTILPDLQDLDVNNFPVIKADLMRYISIFRQQLTKDLLLKSVEQLVRYLTSNVPVVHTYACHSIERILTIKSAKNPKENLVVSSDLEACMPQIVVNLLNILQPVTGESEYAMKTLMRICMVAQEKIAPFLDTIIAKLIELLNAISKNPSKPNFNHYLFETFGILIRTVCAISPSYIEKFEANLFPIFNYVLDQDITEFIPYSFQLLSLMLELHKSSVPQVYFELFPFLLMPVLWERPGYIPALTRLLQAYIEKAAGSIVTEKIMGVLGVFQRLMASKSNDHYAFYILNSLTEYLAPQVLSQYVKQIFVLLFQRLTSSKTTKLVKNMLIFFSLYAYKYGCNNLMELIESMQQGMFLMVLEKLYISDLQKVSGNVDRKICAVGVTKIICECPVLLSNENYLKIWISLLESLIGLFELPEDTSTADDEHFIDVEDTPGYSGSFNQLYSATKTDPDPFKGEIPNPKFYLSKNLENLSSTMPSKIQQFLSQLTPASQNHLQVYLKEANALLR